VPQTELDELQAIKKLLMVLVLKLGGTPADLAAALDVHPSRVSQMLPVKKIKQKITVGK
jgi:hypothetical protein